MRKIILACALFVLAAGHRAEATWAWQKLGGDRLNITSMSMSPDPLSDARALPFRYDLYRDADTHEKLAVHLSIGMPTGYGDGLRIDIPLMTSAMGSASYTFSGASGGPGAFDFSGIGPAGGTLSMTGSLTEAVTAGAIDLTMSKKVFGFWVEIPAVDEVEEGPVSWFTNGDYQFRFDLRDTLGQTIGAYAFYFSVLDAQHSFVNVIDVPSVPEPGTAGLLVIAAAGLLGRRGWKRRAG